MKISNCFLFDLKFGGWHVYLCLCCRSSTELQHTKLKQSQQLFSQLTVKCFNGYSPITGYLLRFKRKASSLWETRILTAGKNNVGAEELVLRDLEANVQYDVQVNAGNRHGYETRSDSFRMTTTVQTAGKGYIPNQYLNCVSASRLSFAEQRSCDCSSPIGAIAGGVAAVAILVIVLLVDVKILIG